MVMKCTECNGWGEVKTPITSSNWKRHDTCPECKGSGEATFGQIQFKIDCALNTLKDNEDRTMAQMLLILETIENIQETDQMWRTMRRFMKV